MSPVTIIKQDGNRSVGIYTDGKVFLAMTYSSSVERKTEAGAAKWLQSRGFEIKAK